MIHFYHENIETPDLQKRKLKEWIKRVAAIEGFTCGEVSFLFCNDEKILQVNRQYLEHDYYTDIITFDYSEGNTISGDIFISIDTVKSNAISYESTYENELYRVIIHGILHLCGQDDHSAEDKETMTMKENIALALLKEI